MSRGTIASLRTYSSLDHFDISPLHATDDNAEVQFTLDWSTVVGTLPDTRTLHLVRNGDHWEAEWPLGEKADRAAAGDPGRVPAMGRNQPGSWR